MPIYKKISGKHFYRDENGKLQCVKEGETITCSPKLLGGSISTFKRVKDDDEDDVNTESLSSESEETDRKTEEVPEEIEKPKKKAKKKKLEKEEVKIFKRKADKDN